jgi:hypothetical protein
MVRAAVRVCCFLALFSGLASAEPAPPAGDPIGPRVRGATAETQQLIQSGIRRSATFAGLVAELNKTRVIVYVQDTRDLPAGVNGQLAVTSGNSQRYLRIQVLSTLGAAEMIATIAHEMQHALEVAAHENVRDRASLVELYKKIGVIAARGRYDTVAAQTAGWRVRAELA